jgi:hypothetical protein
MNHSTVMMQLESLANRLCSLQCDFMCVGGDEQFELESVNFTFMLWDHKASGVKMGCVSGSDELVFVVQYESPMNGKRLFMGTPWLANGSRHELGRELADSDTVGLFLRQAKCIKSLQTNIVFDGNLAVDKPVSLHLQLDCQIKGKSLLVKDVAECGNVLLVIDMFQ